MTKNGEGRSFPITPALRALLERRQEYTRRCERAQARIIPLVFHRKGRPVQSFRRSWAEACKKAGLPGLLFAHRPQDRERLPALRDRGGERFARGGFEAECSQ